MNITTENNKNYNLYRAIRESNEEQYNSLKKKANVQSNIYDFIGETIKINRLDWMLELVSLGAKFKGIHLTIFTYKQFKQVENIVLENIELQGDNSILHYIVKPDAYNMSMFLYFLGKEKNINHQNAIGDTILHLAACEDYYTTSMMISSKIHKHKHKDIFTHIKAETSTYIIKEKTTFVGYGKVDCDYRVQTLEISGYEILFFKNNIQILFLNNITPYNIHYNTDTENNKKQAYTIQMKHVHEEEAIYKNFSLIKHNITRTGKSFNLDKISLLLEQGIDWRIKNDVNLTPRNIVQFYCPDNLELFDQLLIETSSIKEHNKHEENITMIENYDEYTSFR